MSKDTIAWLRHSTIILSALALIFAALILIQPFGVQPRPLESTPSSEDVARADLEAEDSEGIESTSTQRPSPTSSPTATPEPTPTETGTPTQASSPTPSPTSENEAADTDDAAPTEPTGDDAVAPAAPPPEPSEAIEGIVPYNLVMTDAVENNVRSIYWTGQSLGNNPRAFSRVGDCETMSELFLRPIARHEYDLGEFGYLQETVDYYFDSYAWIGYAAKPGFNASSIMDSTWADPSVCQSGESPLACEYRSHRASISFILLRTDSANNGPDSQYYHDLRAVVGFTIQRGIVPVLSTGPYNRPPLPPVESMNDSVRQVAAEYNIPLWDLWLTTESLYDHGVNETGHLTWMHEAACFYLPSIDTAMTRRNLEALQILYTLTTLINQ